MRSFFPKAWTLDGFQAEENKNLSEGRRPLSPAKTGITIGPAARATTIKVYK
jgi:hypothetical protein